MGEANKTAIATWSSVRPATRCWYTYLTGTTPKSYATG